jgi:pimeloyl-ACP methyl ester carboxylesterase
MRASQQEMPMQRRDFVVLSSGSLIAPALLSSATATAGARETAAGFRAARRFVDTRFGRIAHVDRGQGDAVLFLHGLPLNGFQWRDSIASLASDRRCLAPDFLGLGHTEVAAAQSVGPLDQMEMLIAFLDAKAVGKVDVIASDSGGAVAQHLVTRHPERVRSLLLANCDTEIDYPVAALQVPFALSKQGRFANDVIGAWQADKALARSDEKGLGACYADAARLPDEVFDEYLLPLLASAEKKRRLEDYVLALEANPLAGIEPALKQCRVPTRVVWGAADRVFSTKSPEYLAKTFGNSKGLRMLDGGKLFWPEEKPEILVEEARRLWAA